MGLAVRLIYMKLPLQHAGFTALLKELWHRLTSFLFQLCIGTNLNYSNNPASRHEEILHVEVDIQCLSISNMFVWYVG